MHAEGPAAMRAMEALAGDGSRPSPHSDGERASSSGSSSAEGGPQAEEGEPSEQEQGASELSSKAMENAQTPVHYFVMGPHAAWHNTSAWPPPELAPEPYTLFLDSTDRYGAHLHDLLFISLDILCLSLQDPQC